MHVFLMSAFICQKLCSVFYSRPTRAHVYAQYFCMLLASVPGDYFFAYINDIYCQRYVYLLLCETCNYDTHADKEMSINCALGSTFVDHCAQL